MSDNTATPFSTEMTAQPTPRSRARVVAITGIALAPLLVIGGILGAVKFAGDTHAKNSAQAESNAAAVAVAAASASPSAKPAPVATYTAVGGFSADEVKTAITTVNDALLFGVANDTLIDGREHTGDEMVAPVGKWLSADLRDNMIKDTKATRSFVVSPYNGNGLTIKGWGATPPSLSNWGAYVSTDSGNLVITVTYTGSIATNNGDRILNREYRIEVAKNSAPADENSPAYLIVGYHTTVNNKW